mmetsp:Transcript_77258/g.179154  ORF Transcript_77258/g.179154 Transcript_77258/m.179154 type:complete len:233 (-) Transcript_77258:447-1145(-)
MECKRAGTSLQCQLEGDCHVPSSNQLPFQFGQFGLQVAAPWTCLVVAWRWAMMVDSVDGGRAVPGLFMMALSTCSTVSRFFHLPGRARPPQPGQTRSCLGKAPEEVWMGGAVEPGQQQLRRSIAMRAHEPRIVTWIHKKQKLGRVSHPRFQRHCLWPACSPTTLALSPTATHAVKLAAVIVAARSGKVALMRRSKEQSRAALRAWGMQCTTTKRLRRPLTVYRLSARTLWFR